MLVQCAHPAVRTRHAYHSGQYGRIAKRRGAKRAAPDVTHSMLESCHYMLKDRKLSRELGWNHFTAQKSGQSAKN